MLFTLLIILAACLMVYLFTRGGGFSSRPPMRFQVEPQEADRRMIVGSDAKWAEEDWMELQSQFTNTPLWTYRYEVPRGTSPKALVFLFHDLHDHCGRYAHVAESLAQAGFVVLGMDLEGFGKSKGKRGFIPHFHNLVMDVVLYRRAAMKIPRYSNLPQFCLGQGMGGTLSLRMAYRLQTCFRGVIAINPLVAFHPWTHARVRAWAYWLSFLSPVWPAFRLGAPSDWSMNPAVGEELLEDPLCCHGKLHMQTVSSLQWAADYMRVYADEMSTPYLYLHSDMDKLCDGHAGSLMLREAASRDLQVRPLQGAWHDVLHECEYAGKAVQSSIEWMLERYPTQRPKPPAPDNPEPQLTRQETLEKIKMDRLTKKSLRRGRGFMDPTQGFGM